MEEKFEKIEALKVVKELITFPENDIRSRAKLFDYAFEGGKFSTDPKAYPNCQGVVGWINPDLNAPEGDRVYVVLIVNNGSGDMLPEPLKLQFSDQCCFTGVTNEYDGKSNTLKLLEYGKNHGVRFPAAEYAFNYCQNGVKLGEAFIPASEQVNRVKANYDGMLVPLMSIGCQRQGYMLSSTEISEDKIWSCSTYPIWESDVFLKTEPDSISCFIAY